MHPNKPSHRFIVSSLALAAALLLAQAKCAAFPARQQEQQQSQQPPPPTSAQNSKPASQQSSALDQPASKQHRVWTNDDLILLRTPADIYLLEKEAKEAAEAEAAADEAAAKSEKQAPPGIKLPATREESEKLLKETQDDIQEETDAVNKLHKELLDTPNEQQAEKQKQIDRITDDLETLQKNLKALQDHVQTLPGKQQENPPAAPQPPPV